MRRQTVPLAMTSNEVNRCIIDLACKSFRRTKWGFYRNEGQRSKYGGIFDTCTPNDSNLAHNVHLC